jgi:hypothetical protein
MMSVTHFYFGNFLFVFFDLLSFFLKKELWNIHAVFMCPVSNLNMLVFFHEIVVIFVPLEGASTPGFLIPTLDNSNMADVRTCEVEDT